MNNMNLKLDKTKRYNFSDLTEEQLEKVCRNNGEDYNVIKDTLSLPWYWNGLVGEWLPDNYPPHLSCEIINAKTLFE